MSGKRSYTAYAGRPSANYKAARMIGGKVLRFNPSRPVAGSSRAMVAAMRRIGEKKGMDTVLTLSPVISTTTTNASSFVLNLIQSGAGSWQRIGRKVSLESVRLRGIATMTFTPQTTTGDLFSNVLRMVVVWDKQPSGVLPTFDSIFGLTDQTGAEATTFLNPVKYDNMERFSVLKDLVISAESEATGPAGTTTISQVNCPFDEYLSLKGRESVFLGQSSPMTIADISTGGLYVFFRAETNVSTLTTIAIDDTSFARLRYKDI